MCHAGTSSTSGEFSMKDVWRITAILQKSKWSCLLLRIVLQDASAEIEDLCWLFYSALVGAKLRSGRVGKEGDQEVKKKKLRTRASNCRSVRKERKE